jgi:23S rRNA pseudouridine1911/1915/1917 synthase
MHIRQTITVENLARPKALAEYLLHNQRGFKKERVILLFHKKWVLVNDETPTEEQLIKNGDVIKILSPYTSHEKIFAENIPLDIIEETPHWIVLNKPSGMACHGGLGTYYGTLLNALAYYYQNTHQTVELQNGLVHRLDKHTSGLIAVAKTIEGRELLIPQFRNKIASRKYVALVHGIVADNEGTINIPIGRNPDNHLDIRTYPDGSHGKEAITHYKVLARNNNTTHVECELETGRTNQIRIHLQHIGYPIVGDKRYPPQGFEVTAPRLMLHAYSLTFNDVDGAKKVFQNNPPF